MVTSTKLGIDPSGHLVDITLHRSMIGCLLYLTASHSNISFSVGVRAKFQANPKISHLTVVKRIIKYVNGTSDFGLFFSKESNVSLVRYSDADWIGNADDKKTPTRWCFYVGTNLVAWMSKKQSSVFLSTVEAKCIATGSFRSQLLWMKKSLGDYGISQDTIIVYCDNSSAIVISKNPVQHSRTKHIEIKYHFIRDLVERKNVALEYIHTKHQNANIFTKSLDRSKFKSLHQVIGVITYP
ncbi:secreted RxLR effector protein 161-like [Castanea sativa]|uniref:secreted RxLR effector protein 161-like n=1 Tax=Castanea sativa TaxID=21020 RepID=UPI003F64AAA1